MSLKIIDANIKQVSVLGVALNGLIHDTAVMIAEHALQHRDCTRALTLVQAMPASMRRTMLCLWFEMFTPIRVIIDNNKVGILPETSKKFTPWNIDGGKATPFWELAEQNPETKILDFKALCKLVDGLAARISKKIEANEVKAEDIESAKAMAATLDCLNFKRVVVKAKTEVKAGEQDNADEGEVGNLELKVVNG